MYSLVKRCTSVTCRYGSEIKWTEEFYCYLELPGRKFLNLQLSFFVKCRAGLNYGTPPFLYKMGDGRSLMFDLNQD